VPAASALCARILYLFFRAKTTICIITQMKCIPKCGFVALALNFGATFDPRIKAFTLALPSSTIEFLLFAASHFVKFFRIHLLCVALFT